MDIMHDNATLVDMLPIAILPMITVWLLAFFSWIQLWWLSSGTRLSSIPLFLQELRMPHLNRPTKLMKWHFEIFEYLRLFMAASLMFMALVLSHQGTENCKAPENDSNPDIVGSGVRLSMYLLFLAVFASLFIGSFHSGPSGTKELGIATLINLVSLTINLLKVETADLTPTDVFVIIVMIDTHCATLSATLSSKDVLASRLYVRLVVAGQAIAWAAVLYTDIRFATPDLSRTQPNNQHCMGDPWFECYITSEKNVESPFRAYWISHAYDLIQSGVLAACHTKRFDELEKIDRKHQDVTGAQDENQTGYSRLPSTAFSNWRGFILFPIMLIIVVERHLSRNEVNVGNFREWGQSFTIITCTCAIVHWVYVNLPLLKHPFTCLWRGSWVPRRGPVLQTNIMRFIAVGARPSVIGEENYDLLVPEGYREFPENPVRLRVWPQHPPATNPRRY